MQLGLAAILLPIPALVRGASVLALVWLLPPPAPAQRVEFAPFVGGYQVLPLLEDRSTRIECFSDPCPSGDRSTRWSPGIVLGARFGVQLGSRVWIDATAQHASARNRTTGEDFSETNDVSVVFLSLQPQLRLKVRERLEGSVGGGLVLTRVTATAATAPAVVGMRTSSSLGFVMSGAVRVPVTGSMTVELRASDQIYRADPDQLYASGSRMHNDLICSLGVVLGLD
jgi:hypothetical protein